MQEFKIGNKSVTLKIELLVLNIWNEHLLHIRHTLSFSMNISNSTCTLYITKSTTVAFVVGSSFLFVVCCVACSCCYSFVSSIYGYMDDEIPSLSTEARNKNRIVRKRQSKQKQKAFQISQRIRSYHKKARKKSVSVVESPSHVILNVEKNFHKSNL